MIIMKWKKKRKYYLLYFPTIKLNEWMKERKKRNENRSDGKRNRRTLYTTNQRLALDWMIGWVLCGSRSRCEEECKWAVREQRLLITRSNREVSCAERNCLPPLVFCLSVCLGLVFLRCCFLVTSVEETLEVVDNSHTKDRQTGSSWRIVTQTDSSFHHAHSLYAEHNQRKQQRVEFKTTRCVF